MPARFNMGTEPSPASNCPCMDGMDPMALLLITSRLAHTGHRLGCLSRTHICPEKYRVRRNKRPPLSQGEEGVLPPQYSWISLQEIDDDGAKSEAGGAGAGCGHDGPGHTGLLATGRTDDHVYQGRASAALRQQSHVLRDAAAAGLLQAALLPGKEDPTALGLAPGMLAIHTA